ncbi:MAG TPA: hypothetical protein VJI52_00500 [Candidatus Nanoarchaeia archaeon]|nr:hypothetical protein [Candidatus Nanoarchaeia archaeon]
MDDKKAQIQIFETIAVLAVFFILLGIGLIFYTKVIKSNIESDAAEISQGKSVSIAQRAMFLPEIQCSEDGVPKENCIDILKLDSAVSVINKPENFLYYYDLFEFSDIRIAEIYPSPSVPIILYSKPTTDYKNNFSTSVPVTLYDPKTRINKFGLIKIITQTK